MSAVDASQATFQVVISELGNEDRKDGIDISQISEIIQPMQTTRMPNLHLVEGVINLRGQGATILTILIVRVLEVS